MGRRVGGQRSGETEQAGLWLGPAIVFVGAHVFLVAIKADNKLFPFTNNEHLMRRDTDLYYGRSICTTDEQLVLRMGNFSRIRHPSWAPPY